MPNTAGPWLKAGNPLCPIKIINKIFIFYQEQESTELVSSLTHNICENQLQEQKNLSSFFLWAFLGTVAAYPSSPSRPGNLKETGVSRARDKSPFSACSELKTRR